jgi:hypothetical protein
MFMNVYFKDIIILPNEDNAMIARGVFKTLHGFFMRSAINFPFLFLKNKEIANLSDPDTIRVFSNNIDKLNLIEKKLFKSFKQSIKLSKTKQVDDNAVCYEIKKIHPEKLKKIESFESKIKEKMLFTYKIGYHHHKKGEIKYFILHFIVSKTDSQTFKTGNSFGTGKIFF